MSKNYQNLAMRAIKPFSLCALVLTLTAPVQTLNAEELNLQPYKASYTAYKWGDDVGEANIELSKLNENQYSLIYTSKVSKFFLSDKRSEHSIFLVHDNEVVPSQYFYTRTGTGPDKELKYPSVLKAKALFLLMETKRLNGTVNMTIKFTV